MKIAFSKLSNSAYPFKLDLENMCFEGKIFKKDLNLALADFSMKGFVYRICDCCGSEFELRIDENIELFLSNGIFKDKEHKLSDTMEFYDGNIDLMELALSELESFLSDYFYCENCENKRLN